MPNPYDFILPAGIALFVLALAYAPWMRREGSWAVAPAIAVAFLTTFRLVVGRFPPIPALDATGWVFHTAVVAAVVGVLAHLRRLPGFLIGILAMIVGGGAAAAVLRMMLTRPEGRPEALPWVIGAAVVTGLWGFVLGGSTPRSRPGSTVLALSALAILSGVLMGMSASFTYGRLGVALGAATAGTLVFGLFAKRFDPVPALLVVIPVLGALVLSASRFSELTTASVAAIAIAPLLYVTAQRYALPRRLAFNLLLSMVGLLLPLAAAIALALPAFLRTIATPQDPYGQ